MVSCVEKEGFRIKKQHAGTGLVAFRGQAGGSKIRILWMMQLQDDIDKSNPSNPNHADLQERCDVVPLMVSIVCVCLFGLALFNDLDTKHQLVYFLTLS